MGKFIDKIRKPLSYILLLPLILIGLQSGISVYKQYAAKTISGYNVKDYGLKGDGSTNDAAALSVLINTTAPAGSIIYFPPNGTYQIGTGISTSKKMIYVSNGAIISTTSNVTMFTLTSGAEDSEFYGFTLKGNDTGGSQSGIYFNGCGKFNVHDCLFQDFGNAAIVATNIENSNELGGTINNDKFISNNLAINLIARGEYVNITSSTFIDNTVAIKSAAGNTNVHGCIIAYNTTGLQFVTGTNNGHGVVAGCEINHNTTPIDFSDVGNGFTFTGNHIIDGTFSVKTSTGVAISSGLINVDAYTFSNNIGTSFSDVIFDQTLTNSITTTGTAPLYFNCYNLSGSIAVDADNFVVGSNVKYTLTGSATLDFASTAAGASTDMTVTVTGVSDGDAGIVAPVNASMPSNGVYSVRGTASNVATVRFTNNDLVSALDPASGVFKIVMFKN